MSDFDFPETKLRSQNPGGNGPLFTMSRDEILGRRPGSVGDLSGGRSERERVFVDLRTSKSAKQDEQIPPSTNTNREQLLGAMVAGAQAGAQYVVNTTPEPVLGPLSAVGANVITGAAAGVVANTQPILHSGNQILTKELQSPLPSNPELTASRSAEDLQRLIEELNASPLMHIPEELAEGGGRHPLAPHVYVSGLTLGQVPQAFMQPGMPTGVFGLYNPEGEYVGSFHPVPLTGGPITGFGDLFRGYSAGGVFTVPAYGRDGNVELGPGGVAKFVLPGGVEGLFFMNTRVDPAEIPGGNFTLSLQGGVVINPSKLVEGGLVIGGRLVQLAPVPHAAAAGRVIEGAGRAIGFVDEFFMSYYVGAGYRMEARFKDGEFEGLYIAGQRVELEDLVEQALTHSGHFDTPPLIPDGGNSVIRDHNINMRLAYGQNPLDIAYDLQDQPTENSAVQIAQRFNTFIENTMRPNADLLSDDLQRRINLPLTSVNDFGPIYDDFAREVEALGMGHLRDDIGLANPYAIDGGSIALNYANLAAYARLQASGGLGDLSVEEAMRLGILPLDFLETRRQLLGEPEFDEHDPSHSPGGWIELFY